MKKKIFASMALLALLTACNDEYDDQFNLGNSITDVKNITMTLEASDYGSIADLVLNQEIALGKDPENKTFVEALNAVKTNRYFTEDAPAEDYLPAFINSKYPNADAGSKFVVTYNLYQAPSAYLSDFANLSAYDLTPADYKTVWGEKVSASYLSPSSLSKIPVLLKNNITGAAEGDMVAVNYAYSDVEPSIGGGSSEIVYDKISDALAAAGEFNVKGQIIATYARGFLLNDETGTILVYLNTMPNCSVGDIVGVTGTTSKYAGVMQLGQGSEVTMLERSETFVYPTAPKVMTGTELDDYVAKVSGIQYVQITGKLIASGNYWNLEVDGATKQGSITYPYSGLIDATLTGKQVTVTGYLIGASSRYNVMATSIVEAGTTPVYTPIGVVTLAADGEFSVRGQVVATYSRGLMLSDGTGKILVYNKNGYSDIKEGDIVTVSGKTSVNGGVKQFGTPPTCTKVDDGKVTYPAPYIWTGVEMDAWLEAPYVTYVTYTGTLSISGSYYNVAIEDAATAVGSIQFVKDGMVDAALNGQKVTVEGYTISVSGGKYVNTMAVKVSAASTTRTLSAVTRASSVSSNASALYTYDGSAWEEYTTPEAKVTVVDPAVYESLDAAYIETPETVIPTFLNRKYPYAKAEDKVAVVYYKKANELVVAEYTMGEKWAETTASVPATITLTKSEAGVSAQTDIYLNTGFDGGDEGGFTFQDISLSGVTYVWSMSSYGADYYWKAGAYKNGVNNPAESWLISPVVNLKKAKLPELNFDHAHKFLGDDAKEDHMNVLISTNYAGDVTTATWTALTVEGWGTGQDWDMVNSGKIDLSAYVGMEVRIAYKYVSTSAVAPQWEVSKVVVREKVEEETPAE